MKPATKAFRNRMALARSTAIIGYRSRKKATEAESQRPSWLLCFSQNRIRVATPAFPYKKLPPEAKMSVTIAVPKAFEVTSSDACKPKSRLVPSL